MPKLSPLTKTARTLSTIATVAIESQMRRRPRLFTSMRIHFLIPCPSAPMKRGLSNQRKPASSPSIARVATTAVSTETTVPISSISAKPFTWAVATANSTSAVIAVTTFASTIVWKPF